MQSLAGVVAASVVVLGVSACITAPDADNRWNYVCPDDYEFQVDIARNGNSLVFTDAEQDLKLDHKETASGERYTNGSLVFWSKGQMALIRRDGETLHSDCMGDYSEHEK